MPRLLQVVQVEKVTAPPCTRESGMLARVAQLRQRRVHPTDTVQNALWREQLSLHGNKSANLYIIKEKHCQSCE